MSDIELKCHCSTKTGFKCPEHVALQDQEREIAKGHTDKSAEDITDLVQKVDQEIEKRAIRQMRGTLCAFFNTWGHHDILTVEDLRALVSIIGKRVNQTKPQREAVNEEMERVAALLGGLIK